MSAVSTDDPSAPVLAFERDDQLVRSKTLERLQHAWREAEDAVNVACHEAGLLENPFISPGAPKAQLVGFHGLRVREWIAFVRLLGHLERQIEKHRMLLRRALASDAITEDDRQAILRGLYGLRGGDIDSKSLSDTERKIISDYRQSRQVDAAHPVHAIGRKQ